MRYSIFMLFIAGVLATAFTLSAADKPVLLILPMDFTDTSQPPRARFAEALKGCLGGDVVRQRVALADIVKLSTLPKTSEAILEAAKNEKADYVLASRFQIDNSTMMASGDLLNVTTGETVGHIENAGVVEDFVAFQSKLLYQLRDLLPEYVDTTPANKQAVTLVPSGMPVRRDPKVVAEERAAAEAAAAARRDPLAVDASPFIRATAPTETYYVVSPDNPNYLYMEGRNFRGFITVTNSHREQLQRQGSITNQPMPASVFRMPPVGAGNPPMNAAGRTPIGAAGPTPIGAAGPTPINAAGRPPIGAAGQTPIGATGTYANPNTTSNNPGFVQPGLNVPNRSQFGPRGFTTETPAQPSSGSKSQGSQGQGSQNSPDSAPASGN